MYGLDQLQSGQGTDLWCVWSKGSRTVCQTALSARKITSAQNTFFFMAAFFPFQELNIFCSNADTWN